MTAENKDLEWTQTLPFDEKKQNAILGHLLRDRNFFMQAKDTIKSSWFLSSQNRKIWTALTSYYKTWKQIPTKEELLDYGAIGAEDPKNKAAINARLIQCDSDTSMYRNIDSIKNELTTWLHASVFHQNMHDSIGLFNKQHFGKAYEKISETNRILKQITFENDKEVDFGNFQADFKSLETEAQGGLTFGIPAMDKLLLPHIDQTDLAVGGGGLLKGDMTVLLAPTNVGKTTCMISVIRHNLLAGKDVLFLTHEGRPQDIKQKLWCSTMNRTRAELMQMVTTKKGYAELAFGADIMRNNLKYIPFNKPGMTVEEVEAVIRRKNDELWGKKGKGFDLVVDDYPAKLTTAQGGGKLQKRAADEIVYDYFVQLAIELDFHSLVAIQTNRNGSKVNKRQDGTNTNRLVTMEDVAESWGVMTIATNVISINRDEQCKRDNRVIFYIDKSRSSETGIAVATQSDYSRALTHAPEFNHAWYYNDANPGDRLGDLVTQFNGERIPDPELFKN